MNNIYLLVLCLLGVSVSEHTGHRYDTIVIGLGSAGTAAASALARAGKHVLALEAQDRIGGRVKSVPFGDGIVEEGAEWIHGESEDNKNSPNYDAAISNNISIVKDFEEGIFYRSDGSNENSDKLRQLTHYVVDLEDAANDTTELLGDYLTRRIKDYLKVNMPEIYEDEDFVTQILVHMNLLVDSLDATNDWNDVLAHGTYKALDGYQYWSWHRFGYKTFFELLLNTYNNGTGYPNLEIKLNTEVTNIIMPQDPKDMVEVVTKDGTVFKAQNVIVTVSLGVLKERHATLFTPPLPEDKTSALNVLSMGVIGKIILSFPERWWPEKCNIFSFIWKGEDLKNIPVADYWTTRVYSASTPMGANNVLTLWTNGDVTKTIENLSPDIVKSKSLELLRKFMGRNTTIPDAKDMIISKWYSNPYTRGTYTYDSVDITTLPNARAILASPLTDSSGKARIFMAGEATNTHHYSTVHGAAETGYLAASLITKS